MNKKFLIILIILQIALNIYFILSLITVKSDLDVTFDLVRINQEYVEKKF